MDSLEDRVCKYLARVPPSVSGQGGHSQTFSAACSLVNGFALDRAQALSFLSLYNARCVPPWSEKELEHKIDSAINTTHDKPRGHLLNGSHPLTKHPTPSFQHPPKPAVTALKYNAEVAIESLLNGFRASEADLIDASPVRPQENWTDDGWLLLENLYLPGEKINYVTEFKLTDCKDGTTKPVPSGYGRTVERDALIADWQLTGCVGSDAGGWMRMNPVDGDGIADKNITAYRFILLEFDAIPVALQLSVLTKLPLPIACILTSGGKSVHAWVKADCLDLTNYKDTSSMLLNLLSPIGLDSKNKNPSRLSRLVGVKRVVGASDDGRQRLLYLNPRPSHQPIL